MIFFPYTTHVTGQFFVERRHFSQVSITIETIDVS